METVDLFKIAFKDFKFDKPTINLFESFAGVGSQAMALKKLAQEHDFELNTVGISEIDKYAIKSYNAIHGETPNYGDISKMTELPSDIDIFTYSFPCQDISLAGKRAGFKKGGGTRSGLLWEVERLLKSSEKPQVLLMENVKALASEKFQDDFRVWREELENMGYTNYWQILNAKDYGIPQNRERVFMVSILGEYKYYFPKPFELKLRLKDMLEDEVDEKFYLSDKQLKGIYNTKYESMGIDRIKTTEDETMNTIDTMQGGNREPKIAYAIGSREFENQGWKDISPTLAARDYKDPKVVSIPEDTKKGYAEAKDGDGVYINRPHQKRGVVQDGMIQTLKTGQDVGVVVGVGHHPVSKQREFNGYSGICPSLIATDYKAPKTVAYDNLRIRKLTPKETWRLMGFADHDFEKAQAVNSNSQLYKQAGNSIVVDVLYYIFKPLFKEDTCS
jgi:DNA (cytosine-5)-methyltransferase 1